MITFGIKVVGFMWFVVALGEGSWWALAGLALVFATATLDGEIV